MKAFGPAWDAPAYTEAEKVETPVGENCMDCWRPILQLDRGVVMPHINKHGTTTEEPWHFFCFLADVHGRMNQDFADMFYRINPDPPQDAPEQTPWERPSFPKSGFMPDFPSIDEIRGT